MMIKKLFILGVCGMLLFLMSCGEVKEDEDIGSGTASRYDQSQEGLVQGGDINDAQNWGSVVGFE